MDSEIPLPRGIRRGGLVLASALFAATPAVADSAADLAAQMTGSWTSAAQSADPAYDWVESEIVRIWPDRDDGIFLYQENAIIGGSPEDAPDREAAKERPYFQVIIQLRDLGAGSVHTTTWRVSNRDTLRGAWRTDAPDPGGSVLGEVACMGQIWQVAPGYWQGGADCPNTFRGAVRLKSRTLYAPGVYVNWDRGFDAQGDRVWGPVDGGYIFRIKESGE